MSGAEPAPRAPGGPVLVLIGPSGAGKTTIGGLVAQRLGVGFRDTDTDVVERAGKPVAEIFVDDGEPAFRELERAAVAAALAEHPGVLALGGGAVLTEETRALLAGRPVVFLSVGLADAVDRIGLNRDRPLLALNPRAQLRAMLAERQPVYESLAAVTVQTDSRAPDEVADAVLAALGAVAAAPGGRPHPGQAPR
jgi:shikimate kinase